MRNTQNEALINANPGSSAWRPSDFNQPTRALRWGGHEQGELQQTEAEQTEAEASQSACSRDAACRGSTARHAAGRDAAGLRLRRDVAPAGRAAPRCGKPRLRKSSRRRGALAAMPQTGLPPRRKNGPSLVELKYGTRLDVSERRFSRRPMGPANRGRGPAVQDARRSAHRWPSIRQHNDAGRDTPASYLRKKPQVPSRRP